MGLFTALVTLPLAPVRGAAWVAEQVAEEADRQMFDETRIRGELLQLELDHEEGRIGDEERAELEDNLLERLATARQRAREERERAAEVGEPQTELSEPPAEVGEAPAGVGESPSEMSEPPREEGGYG